MTFLWAAFLTTAEQILHAAPGMADPEAAYRTVVGRAYYAAFGEARHYLDHRDAFPGVFGRQSVHAQVIRRLAEGTRHERALSGMLRQLRDARTDADYEPFTRTPWPHRARAAVSTAREAIRLLEGLVEAD